MRANYSIRYLKIINFQDDDFLNAEWVSGNYYSNSGGYYLKHLHNPILLTDLLEIQQYLPDGHPDKQQNIPMKEEEFKVGTYYTYLGNNAEGCNKTKGKAYKLKAIRQNTIAIFDGNHGNECYLKDIRKAELHEIDITNLSNDEILEIAKQYFPKGTKYIPTSRVSKDTDTSTGEFIWGYDKRLEDARLFTGIYEDGKWAKIISSPIENKKETFVLPENWGIKITDKNHEILTNFYQRGYSFEQFIGKYINIYNKNKFNCYGKLQPQHIELSFDQFKKYVLKSEETEVVWKEKRRIGTFQEINSYYPLTPKECISNEIIIPKAVKRKENVVINVGIPNFANVNIPINPKPRKLAKSIKVKEFQLSI